MTEPRRTSPARGPRGGRTGAGTSPARDRSAAGGPPLRRHRTSPGPPGRQRARTNVTGRAAVLALVVCALALTLAYPLRSYLAQRGHVGELQDRLAAQQQRVADLEAAQARWDDPAYVKAQARERLFYVMPGETQYVVLEPEEAPAPESDRAAPPAPDRPWFTLLWESVAGAAQATDQQPAPAGATPPGSAPG